MTEDLSNLSPFLLFWHSLNEARAKAGEPELLYSEAHDQWDHTLNVARKAIEKARHERAARRDPFDLSDETRDHYRSKWEQD